MSNKTFEVEVRGEYREVYLVEAQSETEAERVWSSGNLQLNESIGHSVESVSEIDND